MAVQTIQGIQELKNTIAAESSGRSFSGGFYLAAPWLPTALLVGTAGAALGENGSGSWSAIVLGSLAGLLIWSVFAGIVSLRSNATKANSAQFNAIHARLTELQARAHNPRNEKSRHADEARAALTAAEELLHDPDSRQWTIGSGYNEVWKRFHQVSQNLGYVESDSDVNLAIRRVRARLDDSEVTNKKDLIKELDEVSKKGTSQDRKRTVLGSTARIVDEYRDGRWDTIIALKQDMHFYTGVLATVAYLAFAILVIQGIPKAAIFAASAYLIVGVLVGVLSRSAARAEATTHVEDFGLERAKTGLQVLSAAVVAVLSVGLVAIFSDTSLAALIKPPTTDAAATATPIANVVSAYDLEKFPGGLVIAAIFGLSPKLFLDRLTKVTETLKTDLQLTEASEGKK